MFVLSKRMKRKFTYFLVIEVVFDENGETEIGKINEWALGLQ